MQQQLAVPNAVKAVATGEVNAVQSAVTEHAVLPATLTEAAEKVATPAMPAVPAEIKSLPVVPEVKKQ